MVASANPDKLDKALTKLLWVIMTPLGFPVDPEVYIKMATSSGIGEVGSILKF